MLAAAEADGSALDAVFAIERDDARVLADTREWVSRLIVDFGVCPFTTDVDRAGIPMGGYVSISLPYTHTHTHTHTHT